MIRRSNRTDVGWRSVSRVTVAALACLFTQACASSAASPSLLNGVYVTAAAGGAIQEIGFLDTNHYFLESTACAQAGGNCIQSGTYTIESGTLSLTDDSNGAVSSMPFSILQSTEQTAEGIHILGGLAGGGAAAGDAAAASGGGVSLSSGMGVSLSSIASSILLGGQTFLVWGANGLSGNCASRVCESMPDGSYELRKYSFSASGATAEWDRFSDPACSQGNKLVSIVIVGSAKVAGLSSQIPGAANLIVSMNQKTITPTMAGLSTVGSGCTGYTWQADTSQVVTAGCGTLLQQTDDCTAEYDLMKLTSAGLIFGDRSHPLCSAATRPTTLSEWSVVPGSGYQSPASGDASAP